MGRPSRQLTLNIAMTQMEDAADAVGLDKQTRDTAYDYAERVCDYSANLTAAAKARERLFQILNKQPR